MIDLSEFRRIQEYNHRICEDRTVLEKKAERAIVEGDMKELEWILKKIDDLKYQPYAKKSGPEPPAWIYGMPVIDRKKEPVKARRK